MERKLSENKELEEKIITYLEKIEKTPLLSTISNKKKNLLLADKKEYEKVDIFQKEYQEITQNSDSYLCYLDAIYKLHYKCLAYGIHALDTFS